MPFVVAAMHLAIIATEIACAILNLTKRALAPPWMDRPWQNPTRPILVPTLAGMSEASTLFVARRSPATFDLCVVVTEIADMVNFAEGPAPSVESGAMQSRLIVPPLLGQRWVRLLLCSGHLYEGPQGIEARRFIGQDICECGFRESCFPWQGRYRPSQRCAWRDHCRCGLIRRRRRRWRRRCGHGLGKAWVRDRRRPRRVPTSTPSTIRVPQLEAV